MLWEDPHSFIDVGDGRLAYWRFGKGPDVVFVHGWPLHAATFRHILPELTDAFTCHLVDLPGTGRTRWRDGAPLSFLNHPKVVRRAIDALGLQRYALLAHDSGGFVARHVAAEDDRVTGMVLGNTEISWHRPWLVLAYAWLLKAPGGLALLRTIMRSRTMRRSRLGLGGCFADLAWLDGDFHDLFVRPLLESRAAAEGQATPMRTMRFAAFDELPAVHAAIRAPVRFIWGVRDRFFPLARARPMLREFGGSVDLIEIADGKLFAHEDRASDFAAHARHFLFDCFGANIAGDGAPRAALA